MALSTAKEKLYQFDITPILDRLDFSAYNVLKPVFREMIAQAQNDPENLPGTDPNLNRLLRIARVVIIQWTGITPTELGFGRGKEGVDSSDSYNLIIKAKRAQDVVAIWHAIRDGLIEQPTGKFPDDTATTYNRYEWQSGELIQQKARWFIQIQVTAYKSGKVRRY